jgi:tRNA(fMet)-specific endonuclease VapC
VVNRVLELATIILPLPVVGELLFGAENSGRSLRNLTRYLQFIDMCTVLPMGRETARYYSQVRLSLKRKGRPIPENDVWIGAQTLENQWTLITRDQHFEFIDGITIDNWI